MEPPVVDLTSTATATATATAFDFSSMAQFAHRVMTYPCHVVIKRCKVIDGDGLRYLEWEKRMEDRRLVKKALKRMRAKERRRNRRGKRGRQGK